MDFNGKHQSVTVNDSFANPNDNLFEINSDGSLLGVSFADGSLEIYDLTNSGNDIEILDNTSGYTHFEGGFYEQYLAFSATNSNDSVFAIIDSVEKIQTGGFDSAGYFGVSTDKNGIYVQMKNLLVKIHPVTGEQTPLVTTSETLFRFAISDKDSNSIGIIGDEQYRFSIMKNIIIDICARQYYTDIQMFFVATKEHKDKVRWLRFLPNVSNTVTDSRNIVCDDESKNRVFDFLFKELSQRESGKKGEHIVVFFYDECGFQAHPISKFINKLKELSVTFVFMADAKADIPQGCSSLIWVDSLSSGTLVNSSNEEEKTDFTFNSIDDTDAQKIISLLAPIYTEEISLEGTLTKNISLFEMLNILVVDDLNLEKRWANSKVFQSMAAPIGVTKTGIISLDLHDKAHGPHGLVAGTTGSGKSEVLQTYILSVATIFHPYEVAFVIIDFKGGGMVNQFKNLPHLLGSITNIDGKEIERSLKSIKAELQKRQRLFAEAEVNHIDKYIQKYKAGGVTTPIPHLILIVDEFAELKAEQPEFMKELISAARIGRSLGVHLILATQKPSGQVDDQIWSNSRFKLCLKVQSQEDSNEVLKSPLAAEIKEPGRAYLQVGNNEVFELFQSAYIMWYC